MTVSQIGAGPMRSLGSPADIASVSTRANVSPAPKTPRTHCRRGHELTPDNVFIKKATGTWECRTCRLNSPSRHKRVDVTCPTCGAVRTLSARSARRNHLGEYSGRCETCRYDSRKPPVALPPAEDHEQFWRSRFTQPEINELWSAVSLYLDLNSDHLKEAA